MKILIISSISLALTLQVFSQSRTDAIYYDQSWKICEKPFASSYRIGKIIIDTFWYFKGPVRDYYMNGTLLMEGNYDDLGYKNGLFKFYYENGELKSMGNYYNNLMDGHWKYFYPNGKEKAEILFKEKDFVFIKFLDSTGKKLLDNGSGKFVWSINEAINRYDYTLEGEFFNGKRHGTWKFFTSIFGPDQAQFKEEYDNGKFKKGISHTVFSDERYKKPIDRISFAPYQLQSTEGFQAENCFDAHLNDEKLFDYLVHQKPILFPDTSSTFEGSLKFMIKTLTGFKYNFDYDEKEYNGKISFLLDEEGQPKNISIEGNVTDKEKEMLSFLMEKFRDLKMPGDNKVGIEKYQTIYFFSIDSKDYMKKNDDIDVKEFFFSFTPTEQAKKNIKFIQE